MFTKIVMCFLASRIIEYEYERLVYFVLIQLMIFSNQRTQLAACKYSELQPIYTELLNGVG